MASNVLSGYYERHAHLAVTGITAVLMSLNRGDSAMSVVVAAPEFVTAAAGDLAGIGSGLNAAHTTTALSTTGLAAAAGDEVSAGIAALFNTYGAGYQTLGAQAAVFHAEFVDLLNGSAAAYDSTEIANAEQTLTSAASAPATTSVAAAGNSLLGGLLGGTTTVNLGGGLGVLLGGPSGSLGVELSALLGAPTFNLGVLLGAGPGSIPLLG
jgi:hypothetical protein